MVVTLDRPDRRNAVDARTARELSAVFRAYDTDPALNVAVLCGTGGHFCAGFDLKALAEGTGPEIGEGDGPMGVTYLRLGKPVIAAIEGYCVAGGMELALWCDLRVAASNAVFGIFNRRFGVPLVDGGTVRLAWIAGQGLAMDLILTGRPIGAEEAERHGLVNRVVEPGRAPAGGGRARAADRRLPAGGAAPRPAFAARAVGAAARSGAGERVAMGAQDDGERRVTRRRPALCGRRRTGRLRSLRPTRAS